MPIAMANMLDQASRAWPLSAAAGQPDQLPPQANVPDDRRTRHTKSNQRTPHIKITGKAAFIGSCTP